MISQLFSKSNVGAPFCQNMARKSIKKRFLARASHVEQQKQNQNHHESNPQSQRSFLPNTTTNQQSRGTSLSIKIIANSLCDFILVDYCCCSFFLVFGRKYPTLAMLTMAIAILRWYHKQSN
jgi:hypothetical protein